VTPTGGVGPARTGTAHLDRLSEELTMHVASSWAVQKLAHAVYLNAARDADFERRDDSRAALDAWRRARSAGERASAAALVIRAAERYGLSVAARR
jgi:hypothetical protein